MSAPPPPSSGAARQPRASAGVADDSDPWGPTQLDAESLADRIERDAEESTDLGAEVISQELDPTEPRIARAARPSSHPPPIPVVPHTNRSVEARLEPTGAIASPSRRLAVGTVDGEPPIPRVMGSYTITGLLASGSMGVVLRAEHSTRHQPVAIKVMHRRAQQQPTDVARFFAEAVATARISHPNVVRYFDFGYDEAGTAYLVMELLEGEPLSCRLARERRLDVATAVDIATQLGLALAAAHAQGVVHRDIKPDNIFLCDDPASPGVPVVRLLDFGVAKVDHHSHGTMHTHDGALLGTPSYMAPEQGLSASSSDARSDLYSVGCILFEMLCGVVPFAGNLVETLLAHQTSARPSARARCAAIPVELDAEIDRMLARDPLQRPQTASEVVRTLSLLGAADLVGSRPSAARAGTERVERVERAGWSAWVLVIALAITIGIVVGLLLDRNAGSGTSPEAPARSAR